MFRAVETSRAPTIAVVDGSAMGGGLMLAVSADLCLCTTRAFFGAPVARTLGNCLSLRNIARLERTFGLGGTRRMLLLAGRLDAGEAVACGFAVAAPPPEGLEERLGELVAGLLAAAPLTIRSTRSALSWLAGLPPENDVATIAEVYGSDDFHEGVRASLARRSPAWRGRRGRP